MQEGETRRQKLLQILNDAADPVSGSCLAAQLGVSRQIIVQDIALLRVCGNSILATTRGYILSRKETSSASCHRSYCVFHTDDEIEDELNTIIDNGGKVLDVIIEHDVYGQISADLVLENREDIRRFCDKLHETNAKPLNILAGGIHYHTVEASSEVILDNIERALKEKGYLISSDD